MSTDSAGHFNDAIYAPQRLRICAFLAAVDWTEFLALRDDLNPWGATLSKHLRVLADNDFVKIR